jgi:hypothetical protein
MDFKSKVTFANVASIAIVAMAILLLSPTSEMTGGEKAYAAYGAGLSVDNSAVLKGYATADDSYSNGFLFRLRITVDSPLESDLRFRFNDWSKVGGGGTIATSGNMKVSSDLAGSSNVAAGTTYGSALPLGSDVDGVSPGVQKDVYVWLKVPSSTTAGAYSTNYGISSATP